MTTLELLAPAKDLATGITAIDNGADAVYIGGPGHGARAAAANTVEDIAALCEYAHRFRAKVYVTLNTIIYDDELETVRRLIDRLYKIGVDALIVQDMAIAEMDIPPIPLHASTQCDIRTVGKAAFFSEIGFEQIVLPREMSLAEIAEIHRKVDARLEAFVHGALCVSYSGDCRASFVNGGRSANRGECAQICRLPYDLIDGDNNIVLRNCHLLSLKDLNRLSHLAGLANAGITSFKIEGRLKSADYVANVTAAYSDALDNFIAANAGEYRRASVGRCHRGFTPDVAKAFNRGFTPYFLTNPAPGKNALANFRTPKFVGAPVAEVIKCNGNRLTVKAFSPICNGDGLGFFDKSGRLLGFRVNKFEENTVFLAQKLENPPLPKTVLYRNYDKVFSDGIERRGSRRTVAVKAELRPAPNGIVLSLSDDRGCSVAKFAECGKEKARNSQSESRRKAIDKVGDTIFSVTEYSDLVPDDVFIPVSVLTELRRKSFELLEHNARSTRPLSIRKRPSDSTVPFPKRDLDMHDNVSNVLAEKFYRRHGADVIQPAIEVDSKILDGKEEVRVMSTKYCLRREMGRCLKTPDGGKLKGPLKLVPSTADNRPMDITFDCRNCMMHLSVRPK